MAADEHRKGPPNKRGKLDDSEIYEMNKSMGTLLNDLKGKTDKSIDDIFLLLSTFVEYSIKKEQKDLEMEAKIQEMEEKIGFIDMAHEEFNNKHKQLQSRIDELEKSLHTYDQKKIDNDVFVSLLPSKPDVTAITKKILSLTKFSENALQDSYFIPIKMSHNANSTPKSQKKATMVKYGIVMSFKNFRDKIKFLKNRREQGPLKLNNLINNAPSDNSVRIVNRLTLFNLRVQTELNKLKSNQKIAALKLHNGLYRYQLPQDDNWYIVSSNDSLQRLTSATTDVSNGPQIEMSTEDAQT